MAPGFLTSFTEELTWTGLKHQLYLPQHTDILELSSIEILLDTLTSAEIAARHLARFRHPAEVKQRLTALDEVMDMNQEIRQLWQTWLNERGLRLPSYRTSNIELSWLASGASKQKLYRKDSNHGTGPQQGR